MDLSLIAEKLDLIINILVFLVQSRTENKKNKNVDLIINILVFLVLGSALNFGSLLFRHYRK